MSATTTRVCQTRRGRTCLQGPPQPQKIGATLAARTHARACASDSLRPALPAAARGHDVRGYKADGLSSNSRPKAPPAQPRADHTHHITRDRRRGHPI